MATNSDWMFDLHVSGDTYKGVDPLIEVAVDGHQVGATHDVTAQHSQGQWQDIQITGDFNPATAHQVTLTLLNEAGDGQSATGGHDRNVYVENITMNGHLVDGSQGTNTASNGAVHDANPRVAVMDIDGSLTLHVPTASPAVSHTPSPVPSAVPASSPSHNPAPTPSPAAAATPTPTPTPAPSPASGAVLDVSGDMYQGDPKIEVFVDGHQVGGIYDITAHHSEGQSQEIALNGTFNPSTAHTVQVKFINDAWSGSLRC